MQVIKSIYSQADDSVLFTWVKQSDVKAFGELYNRYWPLLVTTAYKRLRSKEKGEDIVQNIFIDLYNRRAAIELTTSLKAYLHQALRFRVLNEYRSELIRNKYQKVHFLSHYCKIDFSIPLEGKELETKINMILHKLPEKCKQVFFLSRKENLSNKDISLVLRITISTVEKHITRALYTLRRQIQHDQYLGARIVHLEGKKIPVPDFSF